MNSPPWSTWKADAARRLAVLVLSAAMTGCAAAGSRVPDQPAVSADRAPAVSAADFIQAQRRRVQALERFASRGSAELRWKDAQGDHFEQAQVELAWLDHGQRMALRADKVGERLVWVGADASRWWIFEPKAEPSSLLVGPRGIVPPRSPVPFAGPESVMELLAATPWPDNATLSAADQPGMQWLSWRRGAPVGGWNATRVRVRQPESLPDRVELLAADGSVLAASALARPLSLQVTGLPPGAWPDVPGTVRLEMGGDASWEVFWDTPGTAPERLKERLFDLEALRSVLRPQRVEVLDGQEP